MFEGKLIRLRALEPSDTDALFDMLNHPEMSGDRAVPEDYPADRPLSRSQVDSALHDLANQRKQAALAVTRLNDSDLVGHVLVDWGWDTHCPYVFVAIAPPSQRRGYGTEALRLTLHHVFSRTVAHATHTWIDSWNASGLAFARKLGWHECGAVRRVGVRDGAFFDTLSFDLLRPEWKANTDLFLP